MGDIFNQYYDKTEFFVSEKDFFTKEDYDLLPHGAPYQLIGGRLIKTPAPRPSHQDVSRNLLINIHNWLKINDYGKIY